MAYKSLILYLVLMCSCADRERTNPFDPHNSSTQGEVTGFSLTSNRDTVTISWNQMQVNDLQSYVLYRKTTSTTDDPLILSSLLQTRKDTTVAYDSTYSYAIQAVTDYSEGEITDFESIVPGPYNIFISDRSGYSLWRMSYDGHHTLNRISMGSPRSIAYDPINKQVWVADYWDQELVALTPELTEQFTISMAGYPTSVAVDTTSKLIYVLLRGANELRAYDMESSTYTKVTIPGTISWNGEIALDYISSSVWVSADGSGTLYQVADMSVVDSLSGLNNPGRVEADPINGGCWIATAVGIVKFNPLQRDSVFNSNLYIRDISINPLNGDCYYTGYSLTDGNWETGRLAADNGFQSETIMGNEHQDLNTIFVIPGNGDSGFLVNQAFTWKLFRFDKNGTLIGEKDGFYGGLDFALQ